MVFHQGDVWRSYFEKRASDTPDTARKVVILQLSLRDDELLES